jgi:hypothetical protein
MSCGSTISNDAILSAGTSSASSSRTASWSNGLEKNAMPRSRAYASSSPCHSRGSEMSSSSSDGDRSVSGARYLKRGVFVEYSPRPE